MQSPPTKEEIEKLIKQTQAKLEAVVAQKQKAEAIAQKLAKLDESTKKLKGEAVKDADFDS
jgi:arsenate reductase-like glutaredoxin family protein